MITHFDDADNQNEKRLTISVTNNKERLSGVLNWKQTTISDQITIGAIDQAV